MHFELIFTNLLIYCCLSFCFLCSCGISAKHTGVVFSGVPHLFILCMLFCSWVSGSMVVPMANPILIPSADSSNLWEETAELQVVVMCRAAELFVMVYFTEIFLCLVLLPSVSVVYVTFSQRITSIPFL